LGNEKAQEGFFFEEVIFVKNL
jgi:hypothetical protein